ncbi:MAG: hypothetical protein JNM90_11100 [Burkholderiales bacterium]|nr:hypothetical protein [Burkholderiales bacterium]
MVTPDIAAVVAAYPWLPQDYLRLLPRVPPAPPRRRYGFDWFDRPQEPCTALGARLADRFPAAILIGRRSGNLVGYAGWQDEAPLLYEWAGSQQRVVRRFATLSALALATAAPEESDLRARVPLQVRVPGLLIAAWRDGGSRLDAPCILLAGEEAGVLDGLAAALPSGWTFTLTCEDGDSWQSLRPALGGFESCHTRHGSVGAWGACDHAAARTRVVALAPCNDGGAPGWTAHLSLPAPASP